MSASPDRKSGGSEGGPPRDRYAGYDVLDKWDTPSFNDPTRAVLTTRLHDLPERRFLSEDEWRLVEAAAARLIPPADPANSIPITPWIDDMLAENGGDGFRFDGHPPMREAWRKGLAGLDAEARRRHGHALADLPAADQDAVLQGVQQGESDPAAWGGLDPARFLIHELLKAVAGFYYAHPSAWSEIGFGGPASPRGYVRLGFSERDPWEAKEVGSGEAR